MIKPSKIIKEPQPPKLNHVDFEGATISSKEEYEDLLREYQKKIRQVQQAYYSQKKRAVIVLEGWDASGKGGAIRRLTEKLDPRGYSVIPIAAPTTAELENHYLYRFQKELPRAGRIAIFDRSWYGRVLVERVEGFAGKCEWQRAFQEINEFERQLTDDGVRIVKLFLHTSAEEQLKRFTERLHNPIKRWKLTEEDIRNREQRPEYVKAINEMFKRTSTITSPWSLIAGNHKWFARTEVLKVVFDKLSSGIDISPPPINPEIVTLAERKLGISI